MENKEQGFTLIEIIVVLAIMGILVSVVGVGIPGYQDFVDKQNLKGETQRLYYSILQARNNAIMEGADRKIRIIDDSNKIFIENVATNKTSKIELSKGVKIEHTKYRANTLLKLYADGIMAPGGTIILKSPRGKYMTIVIQLVSGRIYIEEGWKK